MYEYKYKKDQFEEEPQNIFFPDNTYYNCDPIPIEWLELFQERNTFIEIYDEDNVLNQIGVNPFASKKELDYNLETMNIHEKKQQERDLNQVDEVSESDKEDKQLYEYSRRIEEPSLKDYFHKKK